jgi:hypothetical protein
MLQDLSNTLIGLAALGLGCAVGGGVAFAMAWLSREDLTQQQTGSPLRKAGRPGADRTR